MLFICILCEFIKPHSIAVDKLFIFHGPSLYETYSVLPNKGTITYMYIFRGKITGTMPYYLMMLCLLESSCFRQFLMKSAF